MALLIPEVILRKIIEGFFLHIRTDYAANIADPTKSLLYRYFSGVTDMKKDYLLDAVDLFTREPDHARFIQTRMFFDASRGVVPTVHITMPSDQVGQNSIGVGENGQEEYVTVDGSDVMVDYERRFDTQYHVVCTSDNHSEVLMMYYLLRGGLISAIDTLSLAGLENVKISGQELKINPDLVPNHIFMRAIGLSFSYEEQVPRWWSTALVTELSIGTVTPKTE
jgi:hypothetical protein